VLAPDALCLDRLSAAKSIRRRERASIPLISRAFGTARHKSRKNARRDSGPRKFQEFGRIRTVSKWRRASLIICDSHKRTLFFLFCLFPFRPAERRLHFREFSFRRKFTPEDGRERDIKFARGAPPGRPLCAR